MPELPEVETIKQAISPHIIGKCVNEIIVRERKLRWLIPINLKKHLKNQCIKKITRRAKYLLFHTDNGCLIMHFGMSGTLRLAKKNQQHVKHDHVDFIFESGHLLRFHDPRKFGSILWTNKDPSDHRLIIHLGVEPLENSFNSDYLYIKSKKHSMPIKSFIMNSHIVVGIGNIYANEVLFLSGINPKCKANKISKLRYKKLITSIKTVLLKAINKGGTTLNDFINSDGTPGYFKNELKVYGRTDEPCVQCKNKIKVIKQNQRSTFYCTTCQT